MKKFLFPIFLTLLMAALAAIFLVDFSPNSTAVDLGLYTKKRAAIDSLQIELWAHQNNDTTRAELLEALDSLWELLEDIKKPTETSNEISKAKWFENQIILWSLLVVVSLVFILSLLFYLNRLRKTAITRQMEKIKEDQRFKTPKGGFDDDPTFVNRTRVRRSIIDDAKAHAEQQSFAVEDSSKTIAKNIAFEDEDGLPENKILAHNPDAPAPLRPTAKERITSAMQSLSDALVGAPKGVNRPKSAPRVRAQSKNTLSQNTIPAPKTPSPLDVTRFDVEKNEKEKVLQLMRRGYTNSEIARRIQIAPEQVETIIRENRETGA